MTATLMLGWRRLSQYATELPITPPPATTTSNEAPVDAGDAICLAILESIFSLQRVCFFFK
jgi:hypothetical protein